MSDPNSITPAEIRSVLDRTICNDFSSVEDSVARIASRVGLTPSRTIRSLLDEHGRGIVHIAAQYGRTEILELYLYDSQIFGGERGHAEILHGILNQKAHLDRTAVTIAAMHGREAFVNALLARDEVDVDVPDRLGWLPVHYAVRAGQVYVAVQLLKRASGTVNAPTGTGERPLHLACGRTDLAVADLCLRFGAMPDLKDRDGNTPAHHAARQGSAELLKLLHGRGSSMLERNCFGHTPRRVCYDQERKARRYDAELARHFARVGELFDHLVGEAEPGELDPDAEDMSSDVSEEE